jgi:hypothetical protein
MSDLNKSFSSLDNKSVITIQDTGLLVQLPEYFRGKPHFLPYSEIAHCTVTDSEKGHDKLSLFLTNKRELVLDQISNVEGESIERAVRHGKNGPLSQNAEYNSENKEVQKKDLKETISFVLIWMGFMLFCLLMSKLM